MFGFFGFNGFFNHGYHWGHHNNGDEQFSWGHHGVHEYWDWNFDSDNMQSEVITGETNTDGTGSSVNLSLDNATLSLVGDGTVTQDGVTLTHSTEWWGFSSTSVYSDEWDADGYKEAQVNNDDDLVTVENITDVNINNTSSTGAEIDLINVKRGVINTGNGDDNIDISVYSNNDHWSNEFSIDTGNGDDLVVMTDSLNTQNTSFEINLGNGNDILDVSALSSESNLDVTRSVDGGSGLDTLVFSGQDTVQFDNFEVIQGADNAGLIVNSDLLASNDSSWFGLVVSNVDVSFDDSVSVTSTDDLSCCESVYLASLGLDYSDYTDVTVTADDGSSYHVLTDDSDYSAAC